MRLYNFSFHIALIFIIFFISSITFAQDRYELQAGDLLVISVWKEEELQRQVLVRPDGGISFPLVGDLKATGNTVDELSKKIERKLSSYITDPQVTVALFELRGNLIYVMGKVNRPVVYPFNQNVDVVQALSMAGGATSFAAVNDIKILRRENGKLTSKVFRYSDIEKGRKLDQNIILKSGDTLVVP